MLKCPICNLSISEYQSQCAFEAGRPFAWCAEIIQAGDDAIAGARNALRTVSIDTVEMVDCVAGVERVVDSAKLVS